MSKMHYFITNVQNRQALGSLRLQLPINLRF